MRVLYLNNGGNRTSVLVPTEGWFRHLTPKGLEPVFVSAQMGPFHTWARQEGVTTYQLPLPFPNKYFPFPFLRALWRLRRLVKRHRIQAIHCNVQDVYPIGRCLGRICRLPVVVSVHFAMNRGFTSWAMSGPRQPERMFFVSRSCLETCRHSLEGVVPEGKWRVLYNGLDLRQYQPDESLRAQFRQRHGLGSDLVIGAAAAFRTVKQFEHLFRSVAALAAPRVRVVVAGRPMPGDEGYAKELLEQGKRLLGDRLTHVGWLEDTRGFFNALDLFVNTSKEESFGISVLQAMACACPVVGYPSVAVEEVVLPGGGEIVPQDDIPALSEALTRWLAEPGRLEAARPDARRRAEYFDVRASANLLWGEYQSLPKGAA
ncbi:MAG: glycosyltransferase family 4 protein [Gemmataceae bacterium]